MAGGECADLAANVVLCTATDMWALRYPESNELYVLDRSDGHQAGGPNPEFNLRTKRIHAPSEQLATRPSAVFATERMDDDPRWCLIARGSWSTSTPPCGSLKSGIA